MSQQLLLYLLNFLFWIPMCAQSPSNLQREVLYPDFHTDLDSIVFTCSNDSLIRIEYYTYSDSATRAMLLDWHNMDSSKLVYTFKNCRVFTQKNNSLYFSLKENEDIFIGEQKIFSKNQSDTVESIGYFYYSDKLPLKTENKLFSIYIGEFVLEDTFDVFKQTIMTDINILEATFFFKKGNFIPSRIEWTRCYKLMENTQTIPIFNFIYMTKEMEQYLYNLRYDND